MVRFRLNQNGMTFIEVMLSGVVTMMFALGAGTALQHRKTSQQSQQVGETLEMLRDAYEQQFHNPHSWRRTITEQSLDFGCMSDPDEDCPDSENPVEMNYYDASGEFFLGNDNAGSGFDKYGQPCEGFGTDPECPIRVDVRYWVEGNSVMLTANFRLSLRAGSEVRVNPNRFNLQIEKDTAVAELHGERCAPGLAMTGFNDGSTDVTQKGRPICEVPFRPCSVTWADGSSQTIAHGATVRGYDRTNVCALSECRSQIRTCNDGTLSGTFNHRACRLNCIMRDCTIRWADGSTQTINHGRSVQAYQSPSYCTPSDCRVQTRSCNNGTLSGSYNNPSCIYRCRVIRRRENIFRRCFRRAYCSAARPGRCGSTWRFKADRYCRQLGYDRSVGAMETRGGITGVRYCHSITRNSGCFTNQNASCNRIFRAVTCERREPY